MASTRNRLSGLILLFSQTLRDPSGSSEQDETSHTLFPPEGEPDRCCASCDLRAHQTGRGVPACLSTVPSSFRHICRDRNILGESQEISTSRACSARLSGHCHNSDGCRRRTVLRFTTWHTTYHRPQLPHGSVLRQARANRCQPARREAWLANRVSGQHFQEYGWQKCRPLLCLTKLGARVRLFWHRGGESCDGKRTSSSIIAVLLVAPVFLQHCSRIFSAYADSWIYFHDSIVELG